MIIKKNSKPANEKKVKAEQFVPTETKPAVEEKIDIFEIDNMDFTQRQERRRGDRRRGFRRIDERNLVSRAQEEAGTIRESAAKEGYKAGIEKAEAEIKEVKEAIMEFLKAKNRVFNMVAPTIFEISVDIAKKIIKKEVEQNPQIIFNTIIDVLKHLSKDESRINIKVNPTQVSIVKGRLPELVTTAGIEAKLTVSPDENIEIGSCIVYTSNGIIDATVKTQLEIIKEALKA